MIVLCLFRGPQHTVKQASSPHGPDIHSVTQRKGLRPVTAKEGENATIQKNR